VHSTAPHTRTAGALFAVVLALLSIVAVGPVGPVGAAGPHTITFDDAVVDRGSLTPAARDAVDRSVEWRAVAIDTANLLAQLRGPVSIELFDDMTLEVAGGRIGRGVSDTTWTARGARHFASLTIGTTEVRGTALVDGEQVAIVPAGGSTHLIVHEGEPTAEMGEPLDPASSVVQPGTAAETLDGEVPTVAAPRVPAADEGPVGIRVLTVFSTDASEFYGGDGEARTAIEAIIDQSNAVLENSGIGGRLESAAIEPIAYRHGGSTYDDIQDSLLALTRTDGTIDDVHRRRDEIDADLVMMVIGPAGQTCGLAWLLQDPSRPLDDEYAFGVIDTNCSAKQFGYIHEVGHILGAGHTVPPDNCVFEYSAGFVVDGSHRTIMASSSGFGCNCDRIPFFSSPRTVDGMLLGTTAHDNSRTLNETMVRVAGFRPLPIVPIGPSRVLETRSGPGTATDDGEFLGVGVRDARSTTELQIAGRAGVPSDAAAVMLNVTAIDPDAAGHVTVYPCDQPEPTASNLNYEAGTVVPNAVLARLDPLGLVCIFTHAATDLVVDVTAYVPAGSTLGTLVPARVLETRPGNATVDSQAAGAGARPAGSVQTLQVAGRGNVPPDAVAAMLNVTAVLPDRAGHATVYPCDQPAPTASNLNYVAGQVIANAVLARLDPQGRVCIYTHAATHLVVDVNGFVEPGSRIGTLVPARLLETRTDASSTTVDGRQQRVGRIGPDATSVVRIIGRGEVPSGATLAVLNVTAVLPDRAGHISAYPCDEVPNSSNLNYSPGQVVANLVVVGIDDLGNTCFYTVGRTDLLVDVTAYM
jgi:hypothetical protein